MMAAEQALTTGLLRSVSVFRWIALAWAIVGASLSTEHIDSTPGLLTLLVVMGATTIAVTEWPRHHAMVRADSAPVIVAELTVGIVALIGDGLVYSADRAQSLPWSWPAAGVMAAGIVWGTRAGIASALVVGSASLVSEVFLLDRDAGWVGAFSKLGLWLVAGGLAGYVARRLRRAEREISLARAREEMARQLHDGVLQTLAVIQRRSGDDELASLARDQEHELRGFLSGAVDRSIELEPELRRLAAHHERLHGGTVAVVVAGDAPEPDRRRLEALTGAVGEALTNAGKHGAAERVTVYVEPADDEGVDLYVSVKDDGVGFDPSATTESIGLSRSIRGRVAEAGGRVEVTSSPGRGAEVQLWL